MLNVALAGLLASSLLTSPVGDDDDKKKKNAEAEQARVEAEAPAEALFTRSTVAAPAERAITQDTYAFGAPSDIAPIKLWGSYAYGESESRWDAGGETADWSLELPVIGESGRRFLFCRGAVLVDADGRTSGQVIVIDDMTAIIGAQRDAAWSEVARRLAHEIKNPLTPIQLSAERLRHKFARKLGHDDVELLTRLTRTIENQVDALKSMVNAFADYASTPRLDLVDTDVNALVRELAELYGAGGGPGGGAGAAIGEEANRGVTIELELDESLPPVPLDTPRLRQLVHNLIKNALEAQQSQPRRVVRIVTRRASQRGRSMLEIVTLDEGPGFAPELLDRLFEPYVTSKPRGTGLGLAVVRKIVEEHDGTIRAENRPGRGASVTVALPCPNVLQLRESAA